MIQGPRQRQFSFRILAAVIVALCLDAPIQAAKTLRWKFQKGQTMQYEMQQNMDMNMTVQGRDFSTKTAQTMDMTWAIDSVGQDGTCRMKQTINRIRMKMEGPMGQVEYDSADKDQPNDPTLNMLRPVFESLVGAEFTVKMSELGRISEVQIPDEFRASLQGNRNSQMSGFSEDSMKQMLQQAALILPERAIATNDQWNSQMKFEMPFGLLKNDNEMTYLGTDETSPRALEKIQLKSNTVMEANPNSPVKVELKEQDTSGTIDFDNTAGRIHGSAVTQKMVMSINAGGQSMEQTVTQTMRLRLKPDAR